MYFQKYVLMDEKKDGDGSAKDAGKSPDDKKDEKKEEKKDSKKEPSNIMEPNDQEKERLRDQETKKTSDRIESLEKSLESLPGKIVEQLKPVNSDLNKTPPIDDKKESKTEKTFFDDLGELF